MINRCVHQLIPVDESQVETAISCTSLFNFQLIFVFSLHLQLSTTYKSAKHACVATPHWLSLFLTIKMYPFIPQDPPHELRTVQ